MKLAHQMLVHPAVSNVDCPVCQGVRFCMTSYGRDLWKDAFLVVMALLFGFQLVLHGSQRCNSSLLASPVANRDICVHLRHALCCLGISDVLSLNGLAG